VPLNPFGGFRPILLKNLESAGAKAWHQCPIREADIFKKENGAILANSPVVLSVTSLAGMSLILIS
jgi:hypothetical protein